MDNKELTSRTIDVMRFPLAVMVVAIHTYFNESLNLMGTEIPFSGEWAHELIRFFSIVLTDAAVPAFFVISGFLYFYKASPVSNQLYSRGGYIQRTKKKIISILIPYIMWNLMAVVIEPDCRDTPMDELLLRFLGVDRQGTWNGPLWFLRDLFIMMVLAPVFEYVIRKTKWLLPLIGLSLMIGNFAGDNIIPGLSYVGITYFSLGAYVGIYHKDILSAILKKKVMLLSIFFLLMITRFLGGCMEGISGAVNAFLVKTETYLYILFSIPAWAIIASMIAERTTKMDTWKWLASSSFVIYVMHRLFNSKVSALGLLLLNKPAISGIEAVILYFITISITVVVCMVTYWLLKKNQITNALFLGARKR